MLIVTFYSKIICVKVRYNEDTDEVITLKFREVGDAKCFVLSQKIVWD